VRQRTNGIATKKSFVVENLLELGRSFSALVRYSITESWTAQTPEVGRRWGLHNHQMAPTKCLV